LMPGVSTHTGAPIVGTRVRNLPVGVLAALELDAADRGGEEGKRGAAVSKWAA
jgi:hypothetical protein